METRFLNTMQAYWEENTGLQDFRPFPDIDDRKAYEELPREMRRFLIQQGEKYLNYEYPSIRATDFMNFTRTGNRVDFQELYFARRFALNCLVTAECVEDKGRFLDDIINGIFAVCEESAWQLPAHNSYVRNTPQEILPDATRPVMDLTACETGSQLSCIRYLLGSRLDAVSPFINTRISHELEHRILKPYLHEYFWWMGRNESSCNNWTTWCTQNVLLSVFLHRSRPDVEKAVTLQAAESLDFFLKDYGEDGCCDEGAQYYRHAGLCLDGAANILNQITGGAFAPLYEWSKIKNIAAYICNVHVDDKYYINFADCSPVAGRAGVREFLFGRRTGQPELMHFAASDFKIAKDDIFADESHRLNLYHLMQTVFHCREVAEYDTSGTYAKKDIYYSSAGLFLSRNDTFCLAVKAGDNDDSHNHNDTGSFTVYKNGLPLFVDIGVENYTKKTFSPQRYEIWTMQSGYHNLPTIEGLDQHDGPDYRAEEVTTSFRETDSSISMELSGAYPLKKGEKHYSRQVFFDKVNSRITLTDTTDAEQVILNFITYEKPELSDSRMVIGDLAEICFTGARPGSVEVLPITDTRLRTTWDHELYRIRLTMTGPEFKMEIE